MSLNLALSHLSEVDFKVILKNGRRSSFIYDHEFNSLMKSSYGFVKRDLPEYAKTGDFDAMILSAIRDRGIGIFDNDIDSISPSDAMAFVLWLMDQSEKLAQNEMNYLRSEPDPDLLAAGIQEMEIFGELNTIDSLAGGDVTKWDEIWKKPYEVIFDKLLKNIYESRVNKRLMKIKNKPKK